MTKYILHGGFDKNISYIKDEFFQEMLKDAPQRCKVLLVSFAESEEMRPIRMEQAKNQFEKNKGSKNIEIKITSPDTFMKDCKLADVIFFSGGRTIRLMEALKNYVNIGEVFKDKIIGGDSAGANFLGLYFYSKGSKEIGKGLGIIPFKIIAHYTEDMGNPLAEIEPHFETLFLHEYETVYKLI